MTNKTMHKYLSRPAQLLLGLVGLLGVTNAALAGGNVIAAPGVSGANTAWTVYAFGNAQAVADSFRALTNFSASPTFQSLVSMIAVIGVLGVGMSGGFNPAMARRFIGYVVSVFIVCYFLFGVTNGGPLVVNVEVIDSVDMTWKAPVTVPAVVGIPASIVSTMGYKITQAIEASFALPTELKMSNGAPFNLAAAMVADASQARITDPNLASSLAYYTQDCFTIGVAQGVLKASTLINSTDFLKDIKYTSDNVMVNTLLPASATDAGGTPDVVTCTEAWNRINTAVNSQGGTAADFLKSATAWSQTPALSVVNSAAAATAQWVSNSGITDGASMVKQAAVLSAFRGAYSQAAAQTGNSDFLTGIAMSQAVESQRTSWITGAEIFNKTMGYIFAILQVFVYAITPLVLMAALVPGLGGALMKNFMQILLWLAIWQPMLSIVNFIVVSMQQADLGGAFSSGTGSFGFTLSNMPIITEKAANLRAAASFVGTMVPALAWAMVKGSVDFSRVIGSAVGENFAQGAANTMTTGNYSLNQASMDSFTANKHSTAATGAFGEQQNTNGSVASSGRDHGGTESDKVGGQMIQGTTSANLAVSDATSRATQAQVVDNSSHSVGAAVADGSTSGANGSVGGGNVQNSGNSTGVGVGAGASIGANIAAPGGKGGGGGNGQGGGGSDGKGDNPLDVAVLGKQGADWLKLNGNLSGRVDASGNGSKSDTHNFSNTNQRTQGGSHSETGTVQDSAARSGSDGQSAGTNDGTSAGQSVSVTGVMSPLERARLHNAYQASMDNANPLLNHSSPQPHSEVNTLFDKTNGAAPTTQAVAAERKADTDKKHELAAEAQHLKANAERKEHAAVDKSHAVIAKNSAAADAAEAPAQVAAYKQLGKVEKSVASDVIEPAVNAYHDFKEKIQGYLPGGQKDAAPASGAPAANPAPAASQAPAIPHLQNDPRQAVLGQPDGHQPQAPAQAQAHAPTTSQSQPGHEQQPAQAAAHAPAGNQPQAQHKPGNEQGAHKPQGEGHQPAQVAQQPHGGNQPGQQQGQQGQQKPTQGDHPATQAAQNAQAGSQPGQQPGQQKPGNEQGAHKPQGDAHQPAQVAQQPHGGNQPGQQQGQQKPTQGDHPPTQAAQNAQVGNQPGQQPGQHKPGNEQGAHKPQGDAHRPAQVAQQPHGGNQPGQQQGQPGHQQPQGDARHPGQVASQTGNRPGEHPNGEQHPGQQPQAGNQPGQHDREREREQQARELAAANSAAQQLQQLQQQQPVAPPVPPVPEAPMQVAQAPQQMNQPGAEGQGGLPNVFSGEKASDGASHLQGQVQLAEQRAERLDNQRRGAEGVLASAEGRRPSELPELINQARDLMRNS